MVSLATFRRRMKVLLVASLALAIGGFVCRLIPSGSFLGSGTGMFCDYYIDPATGRVMELHAQLLVRRVRWLDCETGVYAQAVLTSVPAPPSGTPVERVTGTLASATAVARKTMVRLASQSEVEQGEELFDLAAAAPGGTVEVLSYWRYPVALVRYAGWPAFGLGILGLVVHGFIDDRRMPPPGVCKACGYSRAGLEAGAVCPECGKADN